jgi:hypothetical protein
MAAVGGRRPQTTRAATKNEPATSAKAIDRSPRRLRLLLEVHDASLHQSVLHAASRIGIAVAHGNGGRPLRIAPLGTIAHALRVEAIRELGDSFTLASDASRRARRVLAPLTRDRRAGAALLREVDGGSVQLVARGFAPVDLGEPPEAEAAIREARARGATTDETKPEIVLPEGAEQRARAIVFGPSRTLSEPSSRRVLEAFGLASPPWRLAEDAARAAVHARTIGYPVDLRVASPDVSALDPVPFAAVELRAPGEVREGYRGIAREVRRLAPSARILGVTVTRHVPTVPRLRLTLDRGSVPPASTDEGEMSIALDDPIGSKLTRPLAFPSPTTFEAAASALARFEGRNALPEASSPRGKALIELLLRVARVGLVLSDALVRAELSPVTPMLDDVGWLIGGARLQVRGVDVTA